MTTVASHPASQLSFATFDRPLGHAAIRPTSPSYPRFFLGTHQPDWLERLDVPLFVSHRRLKGRATLPRARTVWALDSGGFTEVTMSGGWQTSTAEYVEAVQRYERDIGMLAWAAPQDWMCEPVALEATGLSIREHQERTIDNYLELAGQEGPFIPVLQGWDIEDYLRCIELYAEAGVDLAAEPLVGVGTVCRRQDTDVAAELFALLHDAGLNCHGFGVKTSGLTTYGPLVTSADSMAWSFAARYEDPMDGCGHKRCNNCPRFALRWWARVAGDLAMNRLVA